MAEMKYSEDHEWVRVEGKEATVGITDYAQEQLGDVVFVELPEVGRSLTQGGDAAVVESVKAASEVYAPLTGEVTATNDKLAQDPSLANSDPTGEGWFFRMTLAEPGQLDKLMDEAAYKAHVDSLS